MITCALDWDGTLTAMPSSLRTALIHLLVQHEVLVIIVTNRGPDWPITDPPPGVPIIYCSRQPKRRAARAAGYDVTWWLDDMPVLVDFGEAGLAVVAAMPP